MSLGLEQARFEVLGAVDKNSRLAPSRKANFPNVPFLEKDIRGLDREKLTRIFPRLKDVDLVVGGPPCQGFSQGGTRDPGDARNQLLAHMFRIATQLKARYIVAENVVGLLEPRFEPLLRRLRSRLARQGYSLTWPVRVLDASEYGVPQKRRRVFLLANRSDCQALTYPPPSAGGAISVWDAIGDLAVVDRRRGKVRDGIYYGKLGRAQSSYASELRGDAPSLSGFAATNHRQQTVSRFRNTQPGCREPVSRFIRLEKAGLAPTLRAGTPPEQGSFMAPRPIHPVAPRCIYLREAARLHGFPDSFEFDSTKWHGFMQIGNSVPPPLALAIASQVRAALDRNQFRSTA